ncbi:MAG: flagellar hook capping FlgD N-terminal domain-containing protein [Caulobacterales bacterium]
MADAISPIGDSVSQAGGALGTNSNAATDAFGVGFQDLLRIVLTQLTYQDPLKPIENFEFVSQLAQFSQIQQTETMSDRLGAILQATGVNQATNLLGRIVEIPAGETTLAGKVLSISFQSGEPRLTILTDDNQTLTNIALGSVSRIAEEN